MKIILLKEIKSLGRKGQIIEVKEGFARNFLLPQKAAEIVTKHNIYVIEAQRKKLEKEKIKLTKNNIALLKKINNRIFEIKVKADKKGSLYSKLDNIMISKHLNEQRIFINPDWLNLKEPIKKIGLYPLAIHHNNENVKIIIKIINIDQ